MKKQAFTIGQAHTAFLDLSKTIKMVMNAKDIEEAKKLGDDLPNKLNEFSTNMEKLLSLIRPQGA